MSREAREAYLCCNRVLVVRQSTIRSTVKESANLVVVTHERDVKLGSAILKDKPQSSVAAAFKKLPAQLTDAETGVHVRLPETVYQIAKGEKTFHSLALRQFTQSPDHSRVDAEQPTQACLEALRPWSS
jgi:hypothetical protein